jgi:hypothetical protein
MAITNAKHTLHRLFPVFTNLQNRGCVPIHGINDFGNDLLFCILAGHSH